MQFFVQRWIRISLFNLLLVSAIGVTLRYKIAFALPWIDQKHLLHSHSHFAFAGWITQALMILMVAYLSGKTNKDTQKKYGWLLFANLITAYGMLVSFFIEGYGFYSIIFSTLSVFVSYAFGIIYWRDLQKIRSSNVSQLWFKAALIFNAVSSLGAYALAIMMITKIIHQNWYLAAEYFYLHFQYNGWFFFSCMGLFVSRMSGLNISQLFLKRIFWLFTCSFIPAYFLSVLWMNFPIWIYMIIVLAAFVQVFGWIWLVRLLKKQGTFLASFSPVAGRLLVLSAIALSIKLLLQLGSVIPSLSDLSYGFRPIIIGYLHLVLLGVITLFILGFMVAGKHIIISNSSISGISIFVSGIIINEILLMLQGVRAMSYNNTPFINELLFITALVMFTGLAIINTTQQITGMIPKSKL